MRDLLFTTFCPVHGTLARAQCVGCRAMDTLDPVQWLLRLLVTASCIPSCHPPALTPASPLVALRRLLKNPSVMHRL